MYGVLIFIYSDHWRLRLSSLSNLWPRSRIPSAMSRLEEDPLSPEEEDVIDWFDKQTENASLVQKQTLQRIIDINKDTEYLSSWLGNNFQVEELELDELEAHYTSLVPLSSHADFEPYLQRIINGDTSAILTRDPITAMALRYLFLLLLQTISRNPNLWFQHWNDEREKEVPTLY